MRVSHYSVSVILSSDGTKGTQARDKAATFALLWGLLWEQVKGEDQGP